MEASTPATRFDHSDDHIRVSIDEESGHVKLEIQDSATIEMRDEEGRQVTVAITTVKRFAEVLWAALENHYGPR